MGTTGSGGASSQNDGGAAGATGSGGDGTPGGTGGASASLEMIDHLDDNDARIVMAGGRQGPWHTFNDQNGGNQQPPIGPGFVPQAGGANNTPYAAHTTGSGYSFGGVGFDLNNATTTPESAQSQAYNASAYTGITFWAKGTGNLRVEFAQRSFVPTDRGGSCTANCWNVYGTRMLQGRLTSSWQQFTIPFSSLQRDNGSTSPAFNPAELMGISFKHEGSTFDFWIDEVSFTRGATSGSGGAGAGSGGAGGRGGAASGGAGGRGGGPATGGSSGTGGAPGTGGSSNVTQPPPISGGTNGWASRYWDCCKPSCGWKANAGGRSPAVSCNQQNMSLGPTDEQNACFNGGNAFMCWNQAPWALDDTLAYGYVAFNGVPCGRCYQIEFTGSSYNGGANAGTGPLNGKTMIVQVTNIGDIGANHFDLMIPGGGVGAAGSGACMRQFGNVDLGATSGGIRTACNGDKNCVMNRCMTLFGNRPDLLAGCTWFVNWFNAADNPNLRYKQIACPQALSQRSGLSDPG